MQKLGRGRRPRRPVTAKYRKQHFIRHLERSEAESKFAKWSGVKWSKPTERSEGEIYEGSPIPHRGDVTSLFHRAQGTVVYGDVVSVIVYRSLRITARRYASVLLCSAQDSQSKTSTPLRFAQDDEQNFIFYIC